MATRPPRDVRRRRVLTAARVVFARQGYAGTRMIDVAGEAAVGKGTLYGYFRSKEELFSTLVVESAAEALDGLRAVGTGDDPLDALARVLRAAARTAAVDHLDLYGLFYDFWGLAPDHRARAQERLREVAARFRGHLAGLAARAVREGRARADLDCALFAMQLCAAVDGLCMRLLLLGESIDVDRYADQLVAVMMSGILDRPERAASAAPEEKR